MKHLFTFCLLFFTVLFSNAQSTSPGVYCTADYTDVPANTNDYIDSVVFNNGNNATNSQFAFPHYVHFPQLDTLVDASSGYNHYQVHFNNSSTTIFYGVWVDFNMDGDFNDVGEHIKSAQTTSNFIKDSFLTPMAVITSLQYRMRIRVSPSSIVQTTSCGSLPSGETEDYTLVMATSTANSNIFYNNAFEVTQNYIDKSLNINSKDFAQGIVELKIYNICGQLIDAKTVSLKSASKIFLNDINSGIYTYVLIDKNGNKLKTGKLIY